VQLRASAARAVELETLISYPERQGHGTRTMERLCSLADELDVTLWLSATPFGSGRQPIPLPKLVGFYHRFGFFGVRRVESPWLCGYHRWNNADLTKVMLRNPFPPRAGEGCPAAAGGGGAADGADGADGAPAPCKGDRVRGGDSGGRREDRSDLSDR
jgi:hypothetical protein